MDGKIAEESSQEINPASETFSLEFGNREFLGFSSIEARGGQDSTSPRISEKKSIRGSRHFQVPAQTKKSHRSHFSMLCERGRTLLLQLNQAVWLPPYDDSGIRDIVKEIEEFFDAVNFRMAAGEEATSDLSSLMTLLIENEIIQRNKRCVLAYLNYRAQAIKKVRWDYGAALPAACRENMAAAEVAFFQNYDELLGRYMERIKIDLTADAAPPKEVFITVRVLKDFGDIETDDGPAHLVANAMLHVRRSNVEHLIRQGILEHIKS